MVPRTYPASRGWSRDGHRRKVSLEYWRGAEKVWVYGALRVRDGQVVTLSARSRNSDGYIGLLELVEQSNPSGDLFLITDNLSSHSSWRVEEWLEAHPRIHQTFIPKGACWLNLQEGWWRLFRREALAGQTFATGKELELTTEAATKQLNRRAKPWVWGRPTRTPRYRRRAFVYRF